MELFTYICTVTYQDPSTDTEKRLRIVERNSPKLSDSELETMVHDRARDILGQYTFAGSYLTDPSVIIGSIEVCAEIEEV